MDLIAISGDPKWRGYLPQPIYDIIWTPDFWDKLQGIRDVMVHLTAVLKSFEGYVSLGLVYKQWVGMLDKYGHWNPPNHVLTGNDQCTSL